MTGRVLIRLLIAVVIASASLLFVASPVFAIALPDSTPTIENIYAYRNVLETGDFLIIIYENTPYSSAPSTPYSEAFIWRWIDTDNTTELASALGSNWNDNGYGYNVISFYMDASEAPTWGQLYHFRLSGTPAAFTSAPEYNYTMTTSDYSTLTDTDAVKAAIASTVITLATDLENKWGLSTSEALVEQGDVATVLTVFGEAFFRSAIYGLQAMAPAAFSVRITEINTTARTWTTTFVTELESQHAGNYIETGIEAGKDFFDVGWNMAGLLAVMVIGIVLLFANWYLSGGNLWRGLVEVAAPMVIATRLGIFGLGELALIAALCWLFTSGKIWRVI